MAEEYDSIVGFKELPDGTLAFKNPQSEKIWKDRYQKNGETLDENLRRVANFVGNNAQEREDIYRVMREGKFFFAGRTMSSAGLGIEHTLNNCFTLNSVPDSMEGIFDTVKIGALTQKAGGGTGYDFSQLRPKGTQTSNDAVASGPVSFMSVFNQATATIMASNRRGANMGIISIYHPDVEEFIECKNNPENPNNMQFFNLSVMVDDAFMWAVNQDEEIELHYPVYDDTGNILRDRSKWTHRQKVRAKDLWEKVTRRAYESGEPGVLFYDMMNKRNNVSYCENIVTSNPCGEYISGLVTKDGEVQTWKGACNLGSLVLPAFLVHEGNTLKFDFDELWRTIDIAVLALDNIIDKNYYPHKDYEDYQKNMRTIGLGMTGLGDVLALLGHRYGSPGAVDFTKRLMSEVQKAAYLASVLTAREKGPFPMYDYKKFQFRFHDDELANDALEAYGIRNARLMSIAPTGTMSMVFGNNCSSGIEPIFQTEYTRDVKVGGQEDANKQEIVFQDPAWERFKSNPSYAPYATKDSFTTALDLDVDEHVRMLSAIAQYTDAAVSKTINIPEDYSYEKTAQVFMDCWKNGVKGCTIFRPNKIRQGILHSKDKKPTEKPVEEKHNKCKCKKPAEIPRGVVIEVDDNAIGRERHLMTGCGTLHLQAFFDPDTGSLLETYTSKGSQGGCQSNQIALSRMCSLVARAGVPVEAIADQLLSAPPCIAYNNRMRDKGDTSKGLSCSAAIGHALLDMAQEIKEAIGGDTEEEPKECTHFKTVTAAVEPYSSPACPECGASLRIEGGCNVCPSCGWSKCG